MRVSSKKSISQRRMNPGFMKMMRTSICMMRPWIKNKSSFKRTHLFQELKDMPKEMDQTQYPQLKMKAKTLATAEVSNPQQQAERLELRRKVSTQTSVLLLRFQQ